MKKRGEQLVIFEENHGMEIINFFFKYKRKINGRFAKPELIFEVLK